MHLSQKGNIHYLRQHKEQNQIAALAEQSLKLSLPLQHSIFYSVFRQSGMIIISKNDIWWELFLWNKWRDWVEKTLVCLLKGNDWIVCVKQRNQVYKKGQLCNSVRFSLDIYCHKFLYFPHWLSLLNHLFVVLQHVLIHPGFSPRDGFMSIRDSK